MFEYNYFSNVINYYMEYISIAKSFTGFTNQMLYLSAGILKAFNQRNNVVVVDHFLDNINSNSYSKISQVINLEETNRYLKQNYNLILADRTNLQFELLRVLYGIPSRFVDVTGFIRMSCLKNNRLNISKNINFKKIKGDPCPGIEKMFLLRYKVNEHTFEKVYGESRNSNITMNTDGPFLHTDTLIGTFKPYDEEILANIVYSNEIVINVNSFSESIDKSKKINIIHLRTEEDAIKHWSNQNNFSENQFKEILETKYIKLIREHVSPEDETIILSASKIGGVIDFLNNDGYNYRFVNKYFKGREKNAIVDLLVSKNCNNVFIGNGGSTFSVYLEKMITNLKLKILIDMNFIINDPIVIKGF